MQRLSKASVMPLSHTAGVDPNQPEEVVVDKRKLAALAEFAGTLVAASQGGNTASTGQAVARQVADGRIAVKVPLGSNTALNFATVKELDKDLAKGFYGHLKTLGLSQFSKIEDMQIATGGSFRHPALANSAFVVSFYLSNGKTPKPDATI